MKKKVRTMCHDCHTKCGVVLVVEDGEIVGVEGDPNHPISEGMLCTKAYSAKEIHEHSDRLKYPLRRTGERGEGKWERITWDEALDAIAEKMRQIIEDCGPESVVTAQGTGRACNAWHYRLQSSIGVPGFSLAPTHVCLLPNLAQTHVTWGRMFHPHEACDYRRAKCNVSWGSNPIRSRQHSGLRMLDSKRDGGKLIVVDPVFRDIASKADVFLQIRPGTDSALALCLSNLVIQNKEYGEELLTEWTNAPFLVNPDEDRLLRDFDLDASADEAADHYVVWDTASNDVAVWRPETKSYDRENVRPALEGSFAVTMADGSQRTCRTAFQEYADYLREFTPEFTAKITWIPEERIREAYDIIVSNKPCILSPYLGACMMSSNALQSGRAITILQILLDPPVDLPGGIFFNPIWDVTFDPKITMADQVPGNHLRLGYDKYPMYTQVYASSNWPASVWEAIETEKPWPVKGIFCVATDLLGCYEDPQRIREALLNDNLEMLTVMDYWMTPTAQLADIVLPAAHWSERDMGDEEVIPDPCIVTIPQIAVDPPGEAKDDWFFWREVGKRLKPEWWPWDSTEEMYLERLKWFYDWPEDGTWEEAVERAYIQPKNAGESRIYEQHKKGLIEFKTASKKIEIYSEAMPVYGYNAPYPTYAEPEEGPVSTPEVYQEYPFVLTTGCRDYPFYHSAWTNIARQRVLEPWPYVEMNDLDARELQISEGEWVYVESPRGRMKAKARPSKAVLKGVLSLPRQNYKDECKELNLPGFDWDQANPNVLIPADGSDPGFGCTPMRGTLARVVKATV
ncbi:hypothetical protein C1878_04935 [Gordonibacter sp. 28C]|uniref:molybdopterin-containing oxidoreductase family protein n=1 Tax=Gordonibacter sp. 28C TaxID=2078569 RepID=UPI000DF770E2|nr:molybdopterin-dependent oxidoreductase [Gordonibacter sp. 28C]RDB63212.1 hypothetical protein C1878_04935 [Gordonibacter sp. 28C]